MSAVEVASKIAPGPGEYSDYHARYLSLVPEGDVLELLKRLVGEFRALFEGLSEADAERIQEPWAWTIKEVIAHVVDTERVFAYRALRFARGDTTPLPSFDQDLFVASSRFNAQTLASLLEEYETTRRATLALYRGFQPEAWERRGVASEATVSVRAVARIIAGHELHHIRILRERVESMRQGN